MLRPVVPRASCFAAAIVLGGCLLVGGCATGDAVDLTGNVVDDVVSVQAPAIPAPSPDLEAGFGGGGVAAAPGGGATGTGSRSTTPTAQGITALGSFARVDSVKVRPGQRVANGQLIAVLDTRLLDANVLAAQAAQKTAQSKVPVLDATLDDIASKKADLAATRSTVRSTVADLKALRAKLADQLATLQATLAKVEKLTAGGAGRPPGGIPTTMPPGGVPPTPGGTPGIPGGLPANVPSPAKLRAGVAQLQSAIAKIDAGIAKAERGLGTLSTASGRLADARARLLDVRELARIAAAASAVGVDLARYQRSLAEVTSPADGVVVSVVAEGDVLAPGATIAEIRRIGPSKVEGWLPPGDTGAISVGDPATVSGDWSSTAYRGRVTRVGGRADYPPTSSATKEVHLTRGVPIELTVAEAGTPLPPGAPVDITIGPRE